MRYFLSLIVFGLVLSFYAVTVYSQTADEMTPAEETICGIYEGAEKGLCNAYCEAMDCDSGVPQASDKACNRILDNFFKATGEELPPCELPQLCSDEVLENCDGAETVICNGKLQCSRQYNALNNFCRTLGCATHVP